ncbi:MAG: 3-demethylubiquinone-9 3-methyltransferase [Candidatus Peregrinibacteria bacterium Greene1014_49]|nr:MAG: 3-demethylubiquinone-9 3-methyltransferase [Candidatus Peregrinibacteria bacterium Greene1014_49]
MQTISSCLWFDTQAEEAAKFYASVFKNAKVGRAAKYDEEGSKVSGQPAGSVMTVEFEIEGYHFTALNGGPIFKITPAISFFVHCKTAADVDEFWKKFSDGGTVRMELGEYPYSKRYGWIEDKFGVSWQLIVVDDRELPKIAPCMLFVQQNFGKAQEALNEYLSVFPDSAVTMLNKAGPAEPYKNPDAVMYASFTLCGQMFTIMDGPGKHAFTFTEGISFVVNCDTQKEIDSYWQKLSAHPDNEQCGWLKDKFGVSWQIVPTAMGKMMSDTDPEKSKRVMKAMLQMKKLDIKKLQEAYDAS